jgi:hypothetical protein
MKPLPWSFSALGDFLNCPKAYYHKRIAKDVQESQGEAALWGDAVHKGLEAYLKGEADLPENLEAYREYAEGIQHMAEGATLLVEQEYALNTKVQPCGWKDPAVWCRGIVDVLIISPDGSAYVIDHKTGKVKPDSQQLKLFALLVFAHHPDVHTCYTEFSWLAFGTKTTECYTRAREADLWQEFLPDLNRYRVAFKHEVFNPRQSGLCNGWCPVTGCEFWKPKKEKR